MVFFGWWTLCVVDPPLPPPWGHSKIHLFSPTIFIKSHTKSHNRNPQKKVLNPPESDCHQVLPHSWSHRSGQNPWYHGWFRWRWRQIEGGRWHWWWRRRNAHLWEGAPSPEVNSLGGKFDFPSWDYLFNSLGSKFDQKLGLFTSHIFLRF